MRRVIYLQNSTDDIVRLMIYTSEEGVYVFGFDDLADNSAKWDNLFHNLEEAVDFCKETYNVDNDGWINIEKPQMNCQHDWIARTRIKREEKGEPQWGQFEQFRNGRWIQILPDEKVNSFGAMTGNERLITSGLLTEFENSLKTDIQNAEKILRALQWDELSLKKMLQ